MAIPIVFTLDKGFQQHVGVTIQSILNTHNVQEVKFYILTEDDKGNFLKLIRFLNSKSCNFEFINIDAGCFKELPFSSLYLNHTVYYRLFVMDYVNEEKIIYLDGDTIVNANLKDLFSVDISGDYIGAVQDIGAQSSFFKDWGLEKSGVYVNAGILLINAKKIKKDKMDIELKKFALENHLKLQWYDQDAINLVFRDGIKILPDKWNVQTNMLKYREDKKITPGIIHYTESNKPWNFCSSHPLKAHYRKVLKTTPWKSYSPFCYSTKKAFQRIVRKIKRILG